MAFGGRRDSPADVGADGELWEGIDWRRPNWGAPPARVGWFYLSESYRFMAIRSDF
ncbi:hypothetical protein VPK21_002171 (plasmid) [Sinorhizobium kummerowiae]|uniref:hypothetical protein n=1 Tax=Sinorhizobium kummerowiae TaxID=158892 RepID=UPI00308B18A5|nr:hypothetical protein VPK21_002171 [Sinorhizobium kummerowiae]